MGSGPIISPLVGKVTHLRLFLCQVVFICFSLSEHVGLVFMPFFYVSYRYVILCRFCTLKFTTALSSALGCMIDSVAEATVSRFSLEIYCYYCDNKQCVLSPFSNPALSLPESQLCTFQIRFPRVD